MEAQRRAVIDIGTNSVKLLVAELAGSFVTPMHEEGRQTRLGRGFYETRRLQPGPLRDTAQAVAAFAARARELGAATPRVIATSAARDATNADELLAAVRAASGLDVQVISGEQEARWAFAGACTHPTLASRSLLLLDTGGGSSEFIIGRNGQSHFHHSYPLGSVRLAESLPHSDPPTAEDFAGCRAHLRTFLDNTIVPSVRDALAREPDQVALVATGGTASVLAMMELGLRQFHRARIEAVEFTTARIAEWTTRIWSLPLAARRELPGLPPERADIILFGVAIFEAIMAAFQLGPLRVSTRGLRFGALLDSAP